MGFDFDLTESLQFPVTSSSALYEKTHKHYLKVQVPGFSALQTNCPKKYWQKLMRLQPTTSTPQIYYLLATHNVGKYGRSVVVSSPLQVYMQVSNLYHTKDIQDVVRYLPETKVE